MSNNQLHISNVTLKKIVGQPLGSVINVLGATVDPYFERFYGRLTPRESVLVGETTTQYSIGTVLNPDLPPGNISKVFGANDMEGACFVALVWLMSHLVLEKNKKLWDEITPIISTGSRLRGGLDMMIYPVLVHRGSGPVILGVNQPKGLYKFLLQPAYSRQIQLAA